MSDDEGYSIVGVIEVVGFITLIFVIMGVFSGGTFLQPSSPLEGIILTLVTLGGTMGLIYAIAKGAKPPPAAAAQPASMATSAVISAKGPAAYVKCPNCGSEELIEFDNERIMIPYENPDDNYVRMSAVNYIMCAKCATMMGNVPPDDTHPKAPVAGVRYQTCEACGGTEFMMNIFTRIRITVGNVIEDLDKTHGPVLCLKCAHPFDKPVEAKTIEAKPAGGQEQALVVVASAASD